MNFKTKIIEISELAKKIIINSHLVSKQREIGGFFFFFKRRDSFLVTHCLVDYKPINTSKYNLEISSKNLYEKLQFLINKYKNIDYLGEWHTHPSGYSMLSNLDIQTIAAMINNSTYGGFAELIHIICYETSDKNVHLKGYIFHDNYHIKADIKEVSFECVISILTSNHFENS